MSDAYVKTYKPLIIWFAAFLSALCILPAALFGVLNEQALTDLMLAGVYLGLLALFVVIHRGGYVYWINGGPSFEEARQADEASRRAYTWAHLKRFLCAGIGLAPYLALSFVLNWPAWLDTIIFGATMIAAALSTLRIRFAPAQEEKA